MWVLALTLGRAPVPVDPTTPGTVEGEGGTTGDHDSTYVTVIPSRTRVWLMVLLTICKKRGR